MRSHIAAALAALVAGQLLGGCLSYPVDVAPATPQRPGFSYATTTTADGTFETEAGLSGSNDFIDLSGVLKYGLGSATELFGGWSPYQRDRDRNSEGTGAPTLGVRHRFFGETDAGVSAGIQGIVKLPYGSENVGNSDETDLFGSLMLSGVHDAFGWTAYYQLGAIGQERGGPEEQHLFAAAGSLGLPHDLAVMGELAWFYDNGSEDDPLWGTVGLTWAQEPSLVWDVAVQLPLNDDAHDTLLTAGFTMNFGRLFGPREEREEGAIH